MYFLGGKITKAQFQRAAKQIIYQDFKQILFMMRWSLR